MSKIPLYLPRGHVYGNITVADGILLDGLTDAYDNIHMGLCAENTASREGFTREDQDSFAIESYSSLLYERILIDCRYRRAAEAWDAGQFNTEIAPVTVKSKKGDVVVSVDEEYKGLKIEKVPMLKPVFK
jgi:acetyl-CoA C-acetyltransferase